MPSAPRTVRMLALASAALFLAVALTIRWTVDGALEPYSGTALYASMVYAGLVFLLPRVSPLTAGAAAIGFCWLVEFAQLTPVPAYLSERNLLARLVLGVAFDPTDLAWYPVGIVPLVALHWVLARGRTRLEVGSG